MANEGNKKRLAANAAFMKTHTMILLIVNAIYLAYRVGLHFASFSGWHWVGLGFTSFVYLLTYYLLRESAKPRYAPLNDGGALLSGGEDMDAQGGVIEHGMAEIHLIVDIRVTDRPRGIQRNEQRYRSTAEHEHQQCPWRSRCRGQPGFRAGRTCRSAGLQSSRK